MIEGGQVVRALSTGSESGYTVVEYANCSGFIWTYEAVTSKLYYISPVEEFMYSMVFDDKYDEMKDIYEKYGYDREYIYRDIVGYISLGSPVFDRENGIAGYVIGFNGLNMKPFDFDGGKYLIQFVDQSGNITDIHSIRRYVSEISDSSKIENLRLGLENFGYFFSKVLMSIRKFGEKVFPEYPYSNMWLKGDLVVHPRSGRKGIIKKVLFDSAIVDFNGEDDILKLRDIEYYNKYGKN